MKIRILSIKNREFFFDKIFNFYQCNSIMGSHHFNSARYYHREYSRWITYESYIWDVLILLFTLMRQDYSIIYVVQSLKEQTYYGYYFLCGLFISEILRHDFVNKSFV